jgi:hypothetical protein
MTDIYQEGCCRWVISCYLCNHQLWGMMMVLLVILMVFLVLLTFLLVTPILLEIDTDSTRPLILRWRGILCLALVMDADKFCGEVKILGFKKEFQFKNRQKKQARTKRKSRLTLHKVMNVLRSFQVKNMDWELDTGNYVLNAQLYSVTWILERPRVQIHLNFLGHNRLRMVIGNRLIRLVWAFIKK